MITTFVKLDSTELKKLIKECIEEVISEHEMNEMWSVADPVDSETDRVFKTIYSLYKSVGKKRKCPEYTEYKGCFPMDIFGWKINVKFLVYDFGNDDSFVFEPEVNNFFDSVNNVISFSFSVKNGEVNLKKVYEVVSHELKHMYQYLQSLNSQSQTEDTESTDDISDVVYGYAIEHMNSFANKQYDGIVGTLFYYSTRYEQDAFLDSLFTQLKKINIPPEVAYEETDFYKRILDYNQKLDLFRHPYRNKMYVMKAVEPYQEFGYDYNRLNQLFTKRYTRLNKKKDMVLMLYNEWYKKNHRPELYDNIRTIKKR